MSDDELETVRDIMTDVRVAMLTSIGEDGTLRSRPLTTQDVEFDGDAWFFVSRDADVAKEVAARPDVNVAYSGSSSWLSLAGRAEIVVDRERKRKYWNNFVEAWFPDGEEDDSVVLLKVSGTSAEYWAGAGRVAALLDMAKARLTGTRPNDAGDSNTVEL